MDELLWDSPDEESSLLKIIGIKYTISLINSNEETEKVFKSIKNRKESGPFGLGLKQFKCGGVKKYKLITKFTVHVYQDIFHTKLEK